MPGRSSTVVIADSTALGARYLTADNDVQYLLRGARADIERMKIIPVPS